MKGGGDTGAIWWPGVVAAAGGGDIPAIMTVGSAVACEELAAMTRPRDTRFLRLCPRHQHANPSAKRMITPMIPPMITEVNDPVITPDAIK